MQDNIMYLNEWTKGNEEIRKDITLDGTILKYKDEEKLDIGNYYLPGILENENLTSIIIDKETDSIPSSPWGAGINTTIIWKRG